MYTRCSDKDNTENRMDEVLDQMPEDIALEFYKNIVERSPTMIKLFVKDEFNAETKTNITKVITEELVSLIESIYADFEAAA